MKILLLFPCLLLVSCANMTANQKKALQIGVAVLAIGAIAAHDDDNKASPGAGGIGPGPSCHPQPDGSCR